MNLAECRPSMAAPETWNENLQMQAILTELLSTDPDMIALQQFPSGMVLATHTFNRAGYVAMESTLAYAGMRWHTLAASYCFFGKSWLLCLDQSSWTRISLQSW
jgi:hypothetical protein